MSIQLNQANDVQGAVSVEGGGRSLTEGGELARSSSVGSSCVAVVRLSLPGSPGQFVDCLQIVTFDINLTEYPSLHGS